MKSKPDVNQFLGGAEAATQSQPAAKPSVLRANKTIRLATDLDQALKDRAYQRTRETGRRVTESDLIDEAIRSYLNT